MYLLKLLVRRPQIIDNSSNFFNKKNLEEIISLRNSGGKGFLLRKAIAVVEMLEVFYY